MCALVLFTASLCRAQIPEPLNAASAPQSGSDHNYIGVGTETVNPADGSLTFHLNVPTTLNDPSGLGAHCTGRNTDHNNVLTCEQAQAAAQLTATRKNSTQERAQSQNGTQERRVGGSRSWRNHNPGNLAYGPFARAQGATGHDSAGFAIFKTTAAGRQAQNALWHTHAYQHRTIQGAVGRWTSGDSPAVQHAYARALAHAAGVSPNTPVSALTPQQLGAMEAAQTRQEGWTPGRVVADPERREDEF